IGHGFQGQVFYKGLRGFFPRQPPYQKSDRQIFYGEPYNQESQGKSRSFYQNSQKETKRKETHQLYKIGQEIFHIGKNNRYFRVIGIEKPQDQGNEKDKEGRYYGKGKNSKKFGCNKLLFTKSVYQILFNGLIT